MPVGESEEDDAGEIGELGEEIIKNDMSDVPIEKPKCLSNINMTTNFHDRTPAQENQRVLAAR